MHYLSFDTSKNISFLSAGRFITQSATPHQKRTLNSAVLLLGYSGECALAQDCREYILKKGTFQLLFPGITHMGTKPVTPDQSHFWCHFNLPDGFCIAESESASELPAGLICTLPEFSQINDCEKYFILFSQMIDESERNSNDYKFSAAICDYYIKVILMSLADSCNNQDKSKLHNAAAISKIKEWLRIHACDGITVHEAASKLGYNSDYLTQLIKSDTGMTTSAYLNALRLNNAKNLLLNTSMTVSEIAYASGFGDAKYFLRLFRRCENITPTQYRNAHSRIHINKV